MFGLFKSKKADVLQHWIAFAEGFQLVPTEFYTQVENELKTREVPGMEMDRVEFAEGGILSDKRLYLRMVRERLVFDVCAAPFGKNFFFSCRFAEIPAVVQLWQLLVLAAALAVCGVVSLNLFTKLFGVDGLLLWPFAWVFLLTLIIYLMRNSVAMGFKDLDKALIQTPVIGAVYEAWIRKETYYRHDTRLMYLEIVSRLVRELAEEAAAANGIKLVRQYEQSPIWAELYKPMPHQREPSTS